MQMLLTRVLGQGRACEQLADDDDQLAGGPSDRRFSRWYTSGVTDWLAGRFKTLRPRRRVGLNRGSE